MIWTEPARGSQPDDSFGSLSGATVLITGDIPLGVLDLLYSLAG